MTDEKKLANDMRETTKAMVAVDTSSNSMLLDSVKFTQATRAAQMFASSTFVPDAFRNNPSNCLIALNMANRLGLDPFMVFQNVYVVHGRPGVQAQLVIALVNQHGPFDGPIEFKHEGEGKKRQCTAYGTLRSSGRVCEATVTWAMVESEGWDKKSGSKWKTMPEQMFVYRSATFLARRYCPEVLFGLYTVDELGDIETSKQAPKRPVSKKVIAKLEEKSKEKREDKLHPSSVGDVVSPPKDDDEKKPYVPSSNEDAFRQLLSRAKNVGVEGRSLVEELKKCGLTMGNTATYTNENLKDFSDHLESLERF